MKNLVFEGAGVAIITPFKNNKVDFEKLGDMIDFQINNKTDSIVICGTTGEASTLTDEEHRACIKYAVEKTAGRVPVIAGTGSNDTDYAIDLSKYACEVGADALLLVTPYYNKATQKGLVQSFYAVADATDKPIILYNVPSRTGCNIAIPTYKELAKHERIVAVKEASGDISKIAEIAQSHHERMDGSGYPNGLTKNEISPEGRLIAVIDSFDTMTSRRVYTVQPKTFLQAAEELYSLPHLYDREVTTALLEMVKSGEITMDTVETHE